MNGLRAQSRVSPAVGLLPLASGQERFGMVFHPFQMKQLWRCDSVVTVSFVGTVYRENVNLTEERCNTALPAVIIKTYRDCKGIKYTRSRGQNTGLCKKLDAAYKQNAW